MDNIKLTENAEKHLKSPSDFVVLHSIETEKQPKPPPLTRRITQSGGGKSGINNKLKVTITPPTISIIGAKHHVEQYFNIHFIPDYNNNIGVTEQDEDEIVEDISQSDLVDQEASIQYGAAANAQVAAITNTVPSDLYDLKPLEYTNLIDLINKNLQKKKNPSIELFDVSDGGLVMVPLSEISALHDGVDKNISAAAYKWLKQQKKSMDNVRKRNRGQSVEDRPSPLDFIGAVANRDQHIYIRPVEVATSK